MSEGFSLYHSPQYFFLLLLVVPLFFFDLKKRRFHKIKLSSKEVIRTAKKPLKARLEFLSPLMKAIALVLLIIAIARPQEGNTFKEVDSEGVDIVLALDTSGSMQALDLKLPDGQEANRLEVVKEVVKDFVLGREYDRIGMVVFGTEAYTQCPLTLDYNILLGYLGLIEIGIAGEDTAIGNAIATGVKRLQKSDAKSKVMVLLTDGENTAGAVSPLKAAEVAKKNGIKIYTIAVGQSGLVPVPVKSFFGTRKVNVQMSVDTETLKEIAQVTDGLFFQATDTDTLKQIYERIDELEKTEVHVNEFSEYHEKFAGYLFPALALFLFAWLLDWTLFLRIP